MTYTAGAGWECWQCQSFIPWNYTHRCGTTILPPQLDTVTSGQGPKEPQTGDDQLAELRRVANEGSTASECSGADLRALIARLDAAEAKCADYQRQAFGESPDTITLTISREDAELLLIEDPTDQPWRIERAYYEAQERHANALLAALREDG